MSLTAYGKNCVADEWELTEEDLPPSPADDLELTINENLLFPEAKLIKHLGKKGYLYSFAQQGTLLEIYTNYDTAIRVKDKLTLKTEKLEIKINFLQEQLALLQSIIVELDQENDFLFDVYVKREQEILKEDKKQRVRIVIGIIGGAAGGALIGFLGGVLAGVGR